ncbi:ABC transporter substrate-binding protein [Vulcanococcus limneticus Candia 3F8]|uniref:ABC transporter substrate-binding protein n=1 Tax=Vulcanococcus limneticus TaxID=2170428 RepID=UPI000B985678|nr:ABC transporter substrate-binding protein [Vulcanococcus limneticus]MCP9791050.1 ABC transporter substrate-binding protein [Vulcanococcus limneticus MW73D5]MCP9892274.1 ABC transporter substrate-binding protein [Vulcanococcus limneticus Candia 3F8]MCP9895904.1 ABC transporter substrate-binding protein [Vulcanococcus limneticus Candia 3B3]
MTPTPPPSTAVSNDTSRSSGPIERRQRGALRLAALLAAGIGALAWLGRSSDPAAKPLTAGPLTLGAAIAFTGNANLYGQDQRMGLSLAERWAGTSAPQGRAVRLQMEDGASDEPSAIAAFNLLIRQGVIALIGPTLSQQAFAANPIAQRQGVPVVAPSNTARGIPEIGHFISRVSAQSSVIAPLSIEEALRRDPSTKHVAVFYAQDDAYSTAEVAIFQKALAARGLTPVTVQRTQLADNDFQTPITSALQLRPQLVVLSVQAVAGGNLIRQLRELGYRGQIVVGNGLNTPNIYPICQRWCDGILIAQAYSPELNTPINRRFQQLFRQTHGDRPPPQITAQAFAAYQVLFEAIQRLQRKGGLTGVTLGQARADLMQELLSGTYDTPLGPIGFSPEGEVLQDRFYVAEVRMAPGGRDGRFALVRERHLQGSKP